MLAHESVIVVRETFEHRPVGGVARVADRHGHVAQQAPPLRPLHGASAETPAKTLLVELCQLVEVGRDVSGARLE